MREGKQKLLLAFFAVFILGASSLTYILLPSQKSNYPVFMTYQPEKKVLERFLREDDVLLTYVWSYDCEKCIEYEQNLSELADKFKGRLRVISLNTEQYPNLPILDIPYIYIIGQKGKKVFKDKLIGLNELEKEICNLYSHPPEICSAFLNTTS